MSPTRNLRISPAFLIGLLYVAVKGSTTPGEILIKAGSRKGLASSNSIKKDDGQMHLNPASDTTIDAGDVLIILGEPAAIGILN